MRGRDSISGRFAPVRFALLFPKRKPAFADWPAARSLAAGGGEALLLRRPHMPKGVRPPLSKF